MTGVALTTVVIPLLAVLLAPLLAYFGVAKKLSGKIATSEAKDLWAESQSIRNDYREEATRLRERIAALEERTDSLGVTNNQLNLTNEGLEKRISALENENKALRDLNEKLRERIDVLEKRLEAAGEPSNG